MRKASFISNGVVYTGELVKENVKTTLVRVHFKNGTKIVKVHNEKRNVVIL